MKYMGEVPKGEDTHPSITGLKMRASRLKNYYLNWSLGAVVKNYLITVQSDTDGLSGEKVAYNIFGC